MLSLLSPLLLLVSFCIWINDRQYVFVKDPLRIGKKGMVFRMYKFRTMIPNAHHEINNNPKYKDIKKKWIKNDGKLKVSEDPRISKIGKILRKTDFDEIPQLLNVLKGEMSLVGPRPMYQGEIDRYLEKYPLGKKYIHRILRVRPGLTGIWQVSGRNDVKFPERMKMESKYASNINLIADIKILLKTPLTVITRGGAYE